MPRFESHIKQAKHNISFLEKVNHAIEDSIDWQVTVCFYTALHIINAYLARHDLQFRKHVDVFNVINPENRASPLKLPQHIYLAYKSLDNLSRRSRYLVNTKNLGDDRAYLCFDKHLAKAIRHLDTIMKYFAEKYGIDFARVLINSPLLKNDGSLSYFKVTG